MTFEKKKCPSLWVQRSGELSVTLISHDPNDESPFNLYSVYNLTYTVGLVGNVRL